MNAYKIYIITVLSTFLLACQTEESLVYIDRPVVESYLMSGDTLYVKISRQVPFSEKNVNYSQDDINNLNINVTYNKTTYHLTPQGKGVYMAVSPLLLVNDQNEYKLKFLFNNDTVSASTTIPSKPTGFTQSETDITITPMTFDMSSGTIPTFPDPIKLTWNNIDKSYYLVVIQCIETNPKEINSSSNDEAPPDRIFRNEPSQTNTMNINAMQFSYYGKHQLILFHLNSDYASLYDDAGTSSQNLTNPSTSIINGVGIFTGISSDTLMLNVKEP